MTIDLEKGRALMTAVPDIDRGITSISKSQHGEARFSAFGPAADAMRWLCESRSDLIAAARERDELRAGVDALQTLLTNTKINCDGSEEQVAFTAGVIEAYDVFRCQALQAGEKT